MFKETKESALKIVGTSRQEQKMKTYFKKRGWKAAATGSYVGLSSCNIADEFALPLCYNLNLD